MRANQNESRIKRKTEPFQARRPSGNCDRKAQRGLFSLFSIRFDLLTISIFDARALQKGGDHLWLFGTSCWFHLSTGRKTHYRIIV
jgi:hypothetical protein